MSTDSGGETPMEQPQLIDEPTTKKPKGCMRGCLIVLGIVVVLVVGLMVLAWAKLPTFELYLLTNILEPRGLDKETVAEVSDAFAKLSEKATDRKEAIRINAELKKILTTEYRQAVLPCIIEARIAECSDYPEEDKKQGLMQLRLFYGAAIKGKITESTNKEVFQAFPKNEESGMKEKWTAEEIKKVMDKIAASVAKLPDEEKTPADMVDYKDVIKRAAAQVIALSKGESVKEVTAPAEPVEKPKATPATKPAPAAN